VTELARFLLASANLLVVADSAASVPVRAMRENSTPARALSGFILPYQLVLVHRVPIGPE
jgi:hypothetical protein